ncbi:MAG: LPP20 family lipoprotein [Calditrichaceae bacterium]|nr:LPP20 family lipoprotein [Calditrichaceae bacterium]RQV97682.1 MAG: hypothetical protein EH224_01295 [Calditrichota bacterium]
MKLIKAYVLISLISLVLIQCSSAEKTRNIAADDKNPSWIDTPHDMYPQEQYFTGVGTGDSRDAAENNAIGSIAKIFQSQVRVSQSLQEAFLETENSFKSESQMNRNTRIGSNLELKNVKVQQSHFSSKDGLYYVLATLDRLETAGLYKDDISKNNASISETYLDAQNAPDKNKKYVLLSRAKAKYDQNQGLKEIYKILMPTKAEIPEAVTGDEINKELNEATEQISAGLQPDANCPPAVSDYIKELIGKIGFPMKEGRTDFIFKYNLTLNPAEMNRSDMTGFNWKLTVEIIDNISGSSMNAFNVDKRTLGISEEQAKLKIMKSVQEEITGSLYKKFIEYMAQK